MALNQMLERRLVLMFDEVRQEAVVRPVVLTPFDDLQQRCQGRKSSSQVTLVQMVMLSTRCEYKALNPTRAHIFFSISFP
jgi:hypothetical protein